MKNKKRRKRLQYLRIKLSLNIQFIVNETNLLGKLFLAQFDKVLLSDLTMSTIILTKIVKLLNVQNTISN